MSGAVVALAAIGVALCAAFVVAYSRRRWWESATGRGVMGLVAMLGFAFTMRFVVLAWGRLPDLVFVVAYGVLDLALAYFLWLLIRTPH